MTIVRKESFKFIQAYNWYTKGFLPLKGGMLNQTNRFLDSISVIDNCLSERDRKDAR